jgi:hypothetical protein
MLHTSFDFDALAQTALQAQALHLTLRAQQTTRLAMTLMHYFHLHPEALLFINGHADYEMDSNQIHTTTTGCFVARVDPAYILESPHDTRPDRNAEFLFAKEIHKRISMALVDSPYQNETTRSDLVIRQFQRQPISYPEVGPHTFLIPNEFRAFMDCPLLQDAFVRIGVGLSDKRDGLFWDAAHLPLLFERLHLDFSSCDLQFQKFLLTKDLECSTSEHSRKAL